ncbi:MAG: hypothetical protein ACRC5M_04515 [Anaeroplasmataceae bacterium]
MEENLNDSLDESIVDSKPLVDFDELEESFINDNKASKEKVKKELESKPKATKQVAQSKSAEDKLAAALMDKKVEQKVETPVVKQPIQIDESLVPPPPPPPKSNKAKTTFALEEDLAKKRAETPIIDEDAEEELIEMEREYESIASTPLIRHHQVVIDEENITPEPFVIETESKEKVVTKNNSSDITDEDQKKFDRLTELFEKRTGYKIYGGEGNTPCIFASENSNLKGLKEINIPVDKIKPIANDDESLKKSFLDQYITMANAKDSTISDHRITRFPLLLSGYYAEMKDYTMGEMTNVIRIMQNPELSFVRRYQEEIASLYNHISWTSLKQNGEKLTFEEWAAATKYKDLDMFYFGAYDATYPGIGNYDITCNSCNYTFRVSKKNRALSYMLQNGKDPILKDTFIKDVLMQKVPVSELQKTLVYAKANTPYDEKVLLPHNIRVSYSSPSVLDVLEYLSVFEQLLTDEVEDLEALVDARLNGHNILTMYTMIDSIVVPVIKGKNEDGVNVLAFHEVSTRTTNTEERMTNRHYIVKIIKDLPEATFADLFKGKQVSEKKNLNGIVHILQNLKCDNCQSPISRIPIGMRDNFFLRTAAAVKQIDLF